MARPTVGRTVHYVSYGTPGGEFSKECRAAIVTGAPKALRGRGATTIDLFVMTPTGTHHNRCPQDESAEKAGGTWHWPEMAEES